MVKKINIYICTLTTLFLLLLGISSPSCIYASEEKTCTINIESGHPGIKWVLYRLGNAHTDGSIGYEEEFKQYNFPHNPVSYDELQTLTSVCENYLNINNTLPVETGTTDDSGLLSFTVDEGWYIVIPEKLITEENVYTSTSVIVCVSDLEIYSGLWGEEVTVYPKTIVSSPNEFEVEVPVTDSLFNDNILLEAIPQTGQLWWPVPILSLTGIILFCCGFLMEKRR